MSKPHKDNWWFSADGRRGFCWDSVKGYDYRAGANGFPSILYLYIESGIFHANSMEADQLFKLVQERYRKL